MPQLALAPSLSPGMCVCIHAHKQMLALFVPLRFSGWSWLWGQEVLERIWSWFCMPWTSAFPFVQWEELDGEVTKFPAVAP